MENKERQIVNRAIRNHIRFMTRMERPSIRQLF